MLHSTSHVLATVLAATLLTVVVSSFASRTARADENAVVYNTLQITSVYISPHVTVVGRVRRGDLKRLQRQAQTSGNSGIPEKFALLETLPARFGRGSGAAEALRSATSLTDGVVVVVWPRGLGISSSRLSAGQRAAIAREAGPICAGRGWTECALAAGRLAVLQIEDNERSGDRETIEVWSVVLLVLCCAIGAMAWKARQRAAV